LTTCFVLCVNPNSIGFRLRTWLHVGNAQVQEHLFATYQREYENFTHLPNESIHTMFQRFTVIMTT
jgi:hypothetical protein